MAMNPQNNNDEQIVSDINMTPLIDIMLVLIIIFMVTSQISNDSGLEIDLPKMGKGQSIKSEQKQVILSLDKGGMVALNGKAVDREQLKIAISEALKASGTTTVIFEGDQKTQLGEAISLMDLAKEAGAENFAVATEDKVSN